MLIQSPQFLEHEGVFVFEDRGQLTLVRQLQLIRMLDKLRQCLHLLQTLLIVFEHLNDELRVLSI